MLSQDRFSSQLRFVRPGFLSSGLRSVGAAAAVVRFAVVVRPAVMIRFAAVVSVRLFIAVAITAVVLLAACASAVFRRILRPDLVREKRREGGADSVLLHRSLGVSCGEDAELNRHDDFFLASHTYRDDQIA